MQKLGVHPGENGQAVRDAFGRVGAHATEDVVSLYECVGGMDIPEDDMWRLWSLEEVITENRAPSKFGVQFSDYMLSCWNFRVAPVTDLISEVYLDYVNGEPPVKVALSLQAFLEVLATEPLKVIDPNAFAAQRAP